MQLQIGDNRASTGVIRLNINMKTIEPKHKLLADFYLSNGFNKKQAGISAGFAPGRADRTSVAILRRPEVAAYVESKLKKVDNKMELTRERILQEVARVALFDPRKMFREDGSLMNIHEMDEDTARCITSMEIEKAVKQIKKKQDRGEEVTQEEAIAIITKKVKTTSKEKGLELAMRHHGMLNDSLALTGANGGPIMVGLVSDAELERIAMGGDPKEG